MVTVTKKPQQFKAPRNRTKDSQLLRAVIGMVSASTGALAVHPVDTIKVRM